MNWKALLAVITLVVLIYSPTWVPAASRTIRQGDSRLAATQRGARGNDESAPAVQSSPRKVKVDSP